MKAFKLGAEWGQATGYVEVLKSAPGPNDVLIRMKAAGLCRTDLEIMDRQPRSSPYADSIEPNFILGHEKQGTWLS